MTQHHRELASLRFSGPRFDDHGIEIDVLHELQAYKHVLVETAKELWRQKNPGRERLPRGFEDGAAFKVFRIDPGSAVVPIMRAVPDGILPGLAVDEFDTAALILADAIAAADADHALPSALPPAVIPALADLGSTLGMDESFFVRVPSRTGEAHYTHAARERLQSWQMPSYQDVVDLAGEVRLADLDSGSFALRLPDGRKVTGKFSPEQETQVVEALREHGSRWLRVQGVAEFATDDRALRRIVRIHSVAIQPPGDSPFDPAARPIWEEVAEVGAAVPEKVLKKLPRDLAKNYRHYLYGAPKIDE